ncbi:hypothetical protein DsansV1_C13g0119391 [Dioscorea sansibarensis]
MLSYILADNVFRHDEEISKSNIYILIMNERDLHRPTIMNEVVNNCHGPFRDAYGEFCSSPFSCDQICRNQYIQLLVKKLYVCSRIKICWSLQRPVSNDLFRVRSTCMPMSFALASRKN